MSENTKVLSNEYLKGVMTDAIVARSQAVDFNQFIPGIFYVSSETLNNPSDQNNGILENVAASFGQRSIAIQRFTTRGALGNAKLYTRCNWLGNWTAWGVIQFSPLST